MDDERRVLQQRIQVATVAVAAIAVRKDRTWRDEEREPALINPSMPSTRRHRAAGMSRLNTLMVMVDRCT